MARPIARTARVLAVAGTLLLSGAGLTVEAVAEAGPESPEETHGISSSLDEFDPLFDDDPPEPAIFDPIEGSNRAVLHFNSGVDRVLWRPLSRAFRFVLPDLVLNAFSNLLWNVDTPAIFMNDILQGRPLDANRTLGRFLLNSTIGLGGLMDPAAAIGLPRHESDFGQTLGRWGVGPGPYLVVPFLGPASVRDGLGGVADSSMNPLTYVIAPGGSIVLGVVFLNFGKGIAVQERYRGELEALKQSSVDYYASLRSLYAQSRAASIQESIDASKRTSGP